MALVAARADGTTPPRLPAPRSPAPSWPLVIAILLASTFVHFPLHPSDFSYDDRDFVVQNHSIRSLSGAAGAWLSSFPPGTEERSLYRPLTGFSYAVDFAIFGMDAWGFHLTNFLLYALTVLVVARLAFCYWANTTFALVVGLLFSVHPVHCEAVDSVTGHSEILALLFSALSLLAFIEARRAAVARTGAPTSPATSSARWLGLSLTCYAAASLSKETGVVLPGILAIHWWIDRDRGRSALHQMADGLRWIAPFAVVLVAYIGLRVNALGGFLHQAPFLAEVTPWGRLHTAGAVYSAYLHLLFYPNVLQTDYFYQDHIGIQTGASAASWIGLAVAGLLLGTLVSLLILSLRSSEAPKNDPASLSPRALVISSIAIFAIFLFPVSHALGVGALMAERFLYAPSLGFCLLFGFAATRVIEGSHGHGLRAAAIAAVAIVILAGAWRSGRRAFEWRSNVALWESAARHTQGDYRIYMNLGEALLENGENAAAERELTRALDLEPENLETLGNLAVTYWNMGRMKAATDISRRIVRLHPEDPMAWNNLGVIESRHEHLSNARDHFRRALTLDPNLSVARRNLMGVEARLDADESESLGRRHVLR